MERLRNPYSGLGQYCLQLGQAFAANPAANEQGIVALVPQDWVGKFGNRVQYKVVQPWHKWFGMSVPAKVWHCMHQDSAYLPTNRKTSVVYTIHDLNFLERLDYSETKKQRKLNRMQRKINHAAGLIYISDFVREQVHARLKVPVQLKEEVIYNGGGHPEESALVPQKTVSINKPFLFSIGIHPKKNLHVLMPLLEKFPQYEWVIAGPDSRDYQSVIQEEAKKWGVAERIHFCGPVGESEKWAYYQSCEALLFPSLSEGFGLPVVEAMAMGKPVFLSTKCSLPEIGGSEAYYFPEFDSETLCKVFEQGMHDFKNDPEKRERLKAWAAQFSWKAAASQYLDFYKALSKS
ncbi:MAG: glycosyltransferase family 4 protein [Saprospiraceae bacterium]|nr:glycosyltransferase family 4 protein [Saprospiraceae bacterium]